MTGEAVAANGTIEKVSIIVSKGSLEGIYPALIMANGARAEGIEANLFFTFFGLDAIHKARHEHIKLATVGNPGLHLATWAGGLPGVSSVMTHYMAHKMGQLDIPPIPEFVEMIADTGAGLYACKASGVPIKELYQLFPKGPAKLAAKIAGIPKPRGCI